MVFNVGIEHKHVSLSRGTAKNTVQPLCAAPNSPGRKSLPSLRATRISIVGTTTNWPGRVVYILGIYGWHRAARRMKLLIVGDVCMYGRKAVDEYLCFTVARIVHNAISNQVGLCPSDSVAAARCYPGIGPQTPKPRGQCNIYTKTISPHV